MTDFYDLLLRPSQQLLRSPGIPRLQREHSGIQLVRAFPNFYSSGMELCAMVFADALPQSVS